MSRRRLTYLILWCALALATIILLVIDGSPTRAALTGLAWLGGIVSVRLYDDLRGRMR